MADHIKLGNKGEEIAVSHLKHRGYQILETNWRYEKCEVDIFCKDKNTLVLVEVKTRSTAHFGNPEEAINTKKQEKLYEAAEAYIEQINHEGEIRFDVISIIKNRHEQKVHHIKDAFFPFQE